jgi:hypothetical protein
VPVVLVTVCVWTVMAAAFMRSARAAPATTQGRERLLDELDRIRVETAIRRFGHAPMVHVT